MLAFDHAAALGVDALECDVHLSRDGEVVVIHDPTLDRTTDASGPVSAITADELARVDAGFSLRRRATGFPFRGHGIGVPRLADSARRVIRHAVHRRDQGDDRRGRARVLDVIREADALDRVIIGGFSQPRPRRRAPARPGDAHRRGAGRKCRPRSADRSSGMRRGDRASRLFQVPFRLRGGRSSRARSCARPAARVSRAGLDRRRGRRHAAPESTGA